MDTCTKEDLTDFWSDLVKDNIAMGQYQFPMSVAQGSGIAYDTLQNNEFRRCRVKVYIDNYDADDLKDWVEEHLGDEYVG